MKLNSLCFCWFLFGVVLGPGCGVEVPGGLDVRDTSSGFNLESGHDDGIADELAAIAGLTYVEDPESAPDGYRLFFLSYEQPVDHQNPSGPRFVQKMTLLHRDKTAPMVFRPEGYSLRGTRLNELALMFEGNQLSVEHRYFSASTPEPRDWQYLTIRQAADDHHRVIKAIRPLYAGAWISSGVSKGGMTAVYHRRFYRDDVDATVAYVAPLSFGRGDLRYPIFLAQVGEKECRARIKGFQREALQRREQLIPLLYEVADAYETGYELISGGVDAALDVAVTEYMFQFWQYQHVSECETIPDVEASNEELVQALRMTLFWTTDLAIEWFMAYFYQAAHQLGYPLLPTAHVSDLLTSNPNDYGLYLPGVEFPEFEWHAMLDIAQWVFFSGESIMFLYGENDPWAAGAFYLPIQGGRDLHRFVVPQGTHDAKIRDLPTKDQAKALDILEDWSGVGPTLPARHLPSDAREVPEFWLAPELWWRL